MNAPKPLTSPRPQRFGTPLLISQYPHSQHRHSAVFCLANLDGTQNNVYLHSNWFPGAGIINNAAESFAGHISQCESYLPISSAFYELCPLVLPIQCRLLIATKNQFQKHPSNNQSLCPYSAAILLGSCFLKVTQRNPATSPSLCLNYIVYPMAF